MAYSEKIFKAYDLRGLYPEEINEEAAYIIGRAFVEFTKAKTVVVGRDMRESGISLFKELARGITDQGANVIDIGMVTTPMLSFTVANYGYDTGIMISASHNPSQYNAFKLIRKPAEQISNETGINEIKELALKNEFEEKEKGKIEEKQVLEDYKTHVLEYAKNISGLKVVVDHGNGVGAISSIPILSELDIDVIDMYQEPDGTFPNHPANPHELENLKDLQDKVIEEKADLGIFYDGDADRSILVDSKGEIVPADLLIGLLALEELKNNPREKVYYDLRFSKSVKEEIEKAEGKPIMMRVGNPFYKSKLINEGGIIAGEFSGHIMFKDNFNIDDGLFAAVKAMKIICESGKGIDELIEPFKKYFQSEEINMTVDDATKTLKAAAEKYSDGDYSDIDGVLVSYDDWWFSLRMSNTEPLVRLRVEANTKELLEEKKEELVSFIKG